MGADEELVRLFEKASKAADMASFDDAGTAEESRCIEAIKLMRDIPVTTSMLISTQVGKRLRRLTKHSRPKIQKAASDLLETWKKLVASESKNGPVDPSSSDNKKTSDRKVESRSKSEVNSHSANLTSPKSFKGESQTTSSTNSVKSSNSVGSESKEVKPLNLALIPKTKEATRDKIRELLAEAFAKVVTEAKGNDLSRARSCDPIAVAVTVETVLFQTLGLSKGVNKMKYRSIMFNVRDGNNPDLRRRLLVGDISPGELVNMSPEDMASDQRKMENEEIKKKALFECERGQARQASTDQFKCGKCGQRKCTYYQMQTRSADEPMTTFVTCVNCNNRWKFC